MAKMRAMVVPKRGAPFEAEERDIRVPGPEEMRLRVLACGVCHSDVVTVLGLLPSVQYPRVPGHEVIGVVDAIGEGVHGWSVGRGLGSAGLAAHAAIAAAAGETPPLPARTSRPRPG